LTLPVLGPTHPRMTREPEAQIDPISAPSTAARNLGLDLVRAVAILLVMVAHYGNNIPQWFHLTPNPFVFVGGEVGVVLFFALSGFLIGLILIRLAETAPTFRNFSVFLVRRWLRTLPLYFLWLALLLAAFPPPAHLQAYILKFGTLTQNLFQPMPPDFFFAVSWSLTIEEWFYILFPCLLFAATWCFGRAGAALWLCLGVFLLAPLALRLADPAFADWTTGLQKQVFYRIDAIAYGVLMATLYRRRSWLFRNPWPSLAVAAALMAAFYGGLFAAWLPPRWFPALIFNVLSIACALCLPAALRLRQAPAWIARPIRLVSSISYGLYIIHDTVLVDLVQQHLLGRGMISAPLAAAAALALPWALAYVSFRFFETPILRRRPCQELEQPRRVAISAAA
jgi:peptidoglycan/LPS O-acetylase OafA/YrhL